MSVVIWVRCLAIDVALASAKSSDTTPGTYESYSSRACGDPATPIGPQEKGKPSGFPCLRLSVERWRSWALAGCPHKRYSYGRFALPRIRRATQLIKNASFCLQQRLARINFVLVYQAASSSLLCRQLCPHVSKGPPIGEPLLCDLWTQRVPKAGQETRIAQAEGSRDRTATVHPVICNQTAKRSAP
jgi:hypothetical protein